MTGVQRKCIHFSSSCEQNELERTSFHVDRHDNPAPCWNLAPLRKIERMMWDACCAACQLTLTEVNRVR